MIWYDQSSSVSAVCLQYLLIKLFHLDNPPDIVLSLIIEWIPKLTGKQNDSHSQSWLQDNEEEKKEKKEKKKKEKRRKEKKKRRAEKRSRTII